MHDPQARARIAKRIHDLLLHQLGEDIDVGLMLGPPEYARAVVSLCRGSGHPELVSLSEDFSRANNDLPTNLPTNLQTGGGAIDAQVTHRPAALTRPLHIGSH